jgi:caspase 6
MESSAMPGYELPTGEKQNMTEADAFYKRETFDPAEQYKMENKRKGIAFINLTHRFSDLGFDGKCFNDLKADELLLKIHEVSTSSHMDSDCFFMCFPEPRRGQSHLYI